MLLSYSFAFSQFSMSDKIFVNYQPINIQYLEINRAKYISTQDYAQATKSNVELKNGLIQFKSQKFEIKFLRGSSFCIINYDNKEHIKQLHLPVVEIRNNYYIPYPTGLTLLDSAQIFKIHLNNPNQSELKHTHQPTEEKTTTEEIIPENFDKIQSAHQKIQEKFKQAELHKNRKNPELLENKPPKEILAIPEPTNRVEHKKKPDLPRPSLEKRNIDDYHNIEIVVNNPTKDIEPRQVQTPPPSSKNQIFVTPILPLRQEETLIAPNEIDLDGYKIPKSLKRKKLEKLIN